MEPNQNTNFGMINGPIPGEGLTTAPGSMPCQNPPQHTDLEELLDEIWTKINNPKIGLKIYGLLKAGIPAESIARTILLGAFTKGVCTVDLALLACPTLVRQVVALGHFLGLKNMKIRNPDPENVKVLAEIGRAIDENNGGKLEAGDQIQAATGMPKKTPVFTGLGA